ncbi:hypothetical protein EII34_03935 [Arachnia propionica]|uniref:Uncharacterized protein n=1 Tax=Arachnia propionica TaxID=1750 RepID=A0A3P1TAB8_9ACTN|nr:hypothetical protein [Arachnia propionica]RRD06280.1 hypothetical protein EII34_03935 [Arachnia propionica]
MASWTDGAAYAPLTRPDGFAEPLADPLPRAEPTPAVTAGAIAPPSGFAPMPPAPALAELGVPVSVTRDPGRPFEVRSALLTATPDLGGHRDPRAPFQITTSLSAPGQPALMPPDPSELMAAPAHPYGPYGAPAQLTPERLHAQRGLITIAGCAFLLTMLVPVAAPYLFATAGVMLLRTSREGRQFAWAAFGIALLTWIASFVGAATIAADLVRWVGACFGITCLVWAFNRRP